MKNRWMRLLQLTPLMGALVFWVGCNDPGPAEQTGQEIDQTADDIQDALDPRGPTEKAGDSIDDAFNLD